MALKFRLQIKFKFCYEPAPVPAPIGRKQRACGAPSAELSRLRRDFLLSCQKEAKPLLAGTRAAAARRSPALLGRRGTSPKLASLKQGDSSAPSSCDARLALRLRQVKQSNSKRNSNSNGNRNRNRNRNRNSKRNSNR
ncbi:hypothetical protein [Pseudoxanthomonas winnipegensis]|uniref:hypothetical protein n=1 Tax=Pseudoxanthomonas winnipegensis TaxID=2480810 RepID=UPI0013F14EF5|nr:hypothetical protein [Pseudoxanthomonas winnipegensis]